MDREKIKSSFFEFVRYAIVGGIAALADMATNYAMLFYVLGATKDDRWQVALSVAAGFIVGIAVNFILANIFVFRTAEQREVGMTAGAFVIYTVVGIVGFAITEVLTLAGTYFIGEEEIWYIILNCAVKGIVLIWNYLGRKIFVYRGK